MQPRIASLQPSVSVTLAALGRLHHVVACTKYCVAQVPELAHAGLPLLDDTWTFNERDVTRMRELRVDLAVASVPYREQALETLLRAGLPVLALSPRSLADVYLDTRLLASLVHAANHAEEMVAEFQARLDHARTRSAGRSMTIYCEEWGKPLIHSQPWVYELAEACGASAIGEPGKRTTAEDIAAADPDAIVLAWCGAGDRVPLAKVAEQRGWQHLRAVRDGRAAVIPDEFLNTPALPSLADGLREIAKLLER